MASDREIDAVMERWHGLPGEARETVARLERIARQAVAELTAERERTRRMVAALRAAVPMHHTECGLSPRGGECDCWMRLRGAALAEYEGGQTDGE